MPHEAQFPARLLVAVGGNATHPEEIRGTADEQKIIAARTARSLLPLAQLDNELVITHGNGPVAKHRERGDGALGGPAGLQRAAGMAVRERRRSRREDE